MSGRLDVSAYEVKDPLDVNRNGEARIDIKFQVPDIEQLQRENANDKIRRAVYEAIKKYLKTKLENNNEALEKPNLYGKKDLLAAAIEKFKEDEIHVDKETRSLGGSQDSRIYVHCTIGCLDMYRQYYIDAWQFCIKNKKFSHRLLRNLQMDKKDSHRLLFSAMKVTYSNSNTVDQDIDSVEMIPFSKNNSGSWAQYQNYLKRKKQLQKEDEESKKEQETNNDDNGDNGDNGDNENDNNSNENENDNLKSPKDGVDDSNDGSSFAMVDGDGMEAMNGNGNVENGGNSNNNSSSNDNNTNTNNNNNNSNNQTSGNNGNNENSNDSDSPPVVVDKSESVFVHSDVEDENNEDADDDEDDDDESNIHDSVNDDSNGLKSNNNPNMNRNINDYNASRDSSSQPPPNGGGAASEDQEVKTTQTPKERSREAVENTNVNDDTPTPIPDTPEPNDGSQTTTTVDIDSNGATPVTPTPASTTPQAENGNDDSNNNGNNGSNPNNSSVKSNNLQNPSKSGRMMNNNNRSGGAALPNDKKETYDELLKTKKELRKQQLAYKEEINRMEARIHALKWKHKRELEEAAANGFDVSKYEELRKSHMSMQIDNEMLDQTHRQENEQRMRRLEEQIIKQKQEFEKKISSMQHEHMTQLTKMRRLSQQKIETSKLELEEMEKQHITERRQLQSQVKALQGSLERESKKDKMIRGLRSEVESLQKKSDGIRDDYEETIRKMQNEFEEELEIETNRRIRDTSDLNQKLRFTNSELTNFKKTISDYEKQIHELKTKNKAAQHLSEHYQSLFKTEKHKVNKLENQIKYLKQKNQNVNENSKDDRDDKYENSSGKDGTNKAPVGHRRVRSLRKRGSSITIFDEGGQKTIEIVNDGMEPVSETLDFTATNTTTTAIDEEKTIENNYNPIHSGHNSDNDSHGVDLVSRKEYERLKKQLKYISEENTEYSKEQIRLNEKIDELVEKQKQELSKIRETTGEEQMRIKERLEFQLRRKDVLIQRLEENNDKLSQQMTKELEDKDYLINKLEEDVMAKEEELSAMQTNISYLENQMNSFQAYDNNYDDFEDDILSMEAENEQLLEQQDIINEELRKTKEELANLKNTISQKETENAQKENTIHRHEASIAELETLLKDLDIKKEALDEQSAKYNNLMGKIETLEKENQELTEYKRSSISLNAVQRPSFEAKLALSGEDHGNIKTLQPQMSEKEKMQPQLVMTPTNGIGSVPDEMEDMGTTPHFMATTNENENNDDNRMNNNNNNNSGSGDGNNVSNINTQDVSNDPTMNNNGTRLSVVEEDNVNGNYPNNTRSDAEWQSILDLKIEETEKNVREAVIHELRLELESEFEQKLNREMGMVSNQTREIVVNEYEQSINLLKKQLEDSRLECEDKQRKFVQCEKEMNRVIESKIQLLETFNTAMNAMRDELRPNKKR